jgi:hypothetical protein
MGRSSRPWRRGGFGSGSTRRRYGDSTIVRYLYPPVSEGVNKSQNVGVNGIVFVLTDPRQRIIILSSMSRAGVLQGIFRCRLGRKRSGRVLLDQQQTIHFGCATLAEICPLYTPWTSTKYQCFVGKHMFPYLFTVFLSWDLEADFCVFSRWGSQK